MTAGDIYAVAGSGRDRYSGDGGPALAAGMNGPTWVTTDSAGNLLIADGNDARIRVMAAATGTFYGVPMTAGDVYTVAGNGTPGFSGDGQVATGAELDEPFGVGIDAAGNLLVADLSDGRVRQVSG